MKQLLFTFIIIGGLALNANAQRAAYVDADYIISNLPDTKAATATLQEYQAALIQRLNEKEKEYLKFIEDIQGKIAKGELSPIEQKEAERYIIRLEGEYEQLSSEIDSQLAVRQQELQEPIKKKVSLAIQQVAQKQGFTYVIDKEAVFYSDDSTMVNASIMVLNQLLKK